MKWKEQITIPNLLTFLRLTAIPWMAVEIYRTNASSLLSAALFVGIWCTDVLDGWIARRFNQVSDFGKVFDPAVDKIFQITTAVMMTVVGRVPIWVPICIFIKELIMAIGSLILIHLRVVPSAKWYGKFSTFLFVLGFAILFLLPQDKLWVSDYIFVFPIFMMFLSFALYTISAIKVYKKGKED